jgi:serine/threonine protein kinase
MVTESEAGVKSAVLTDYGLVTHCGFSETIEERCGSIGYVAPEVFSGSYGQLADIFSAGVTIYTILTGRMPFGNTNTAELNMQGTIVFDKRIWNHLSADAQSFVKAMTTKAVTRRPTAR